MFLIMLVFKRLRSIPAVTDLNSNSIFFPCNSNYYNTYFSKKPIMGQHWERPLFHKCQMEDYPLFDKEG
jgi:hypothetical protein